MNIPHLQNILKTLEYESKLVETLKVTGDNANTTKDFKINPE
jgi:hypothetical protein